jgi:hypothetical protein
MSYDHFVLKCKKIGLDPSTYLMPEKFFKLLQNELEYTTSDVALYLEVSDRHARRILNKGQAKFVRFRPYTCSGIEAKRAVFKVYSKYIIGNTPF